MSHGETHLVLLVGAIQVGIDEAFNLVINVQAAGEVVAEIKLVNPAQGNLKRILVIFIKSFLVLSVQLDCAERGGVEAGRTYDGLEVGIILYKLL